MKITIYILSFILICLIIVIFSLWKAICKILDDNPEVAIKYYFDHEVEETFPCYLLLSIKEGANFDGSSFDFSKYKDKKIIALTEFRKEITMPEGSEAYSTILLKNQIVYKMKDGSFQWDFRRLM